MTCIGVCAVEPMYGVIVYPVSELPPSLLGVFQVTTASLDAGDAATPAGAEGTVGAVGVTALEASDSGPEPLGLDAVTVNV
jgi:hypothetical protein